VEVDAGPAPRSSLGVMLHRWPMRDTIHVLAYGAGVVPSFRSGEIVRVTALPDDADAEDGWVLGVQGRLDRPSGPNEAGTGWCYLVWIRSRDDETLWIFDAADLSSCGTVATESGLVPTDDVPLPPEMGDEITMRLVTSETDLVRAQAVEADVRKSVTLLLPGAQLLINPKRHWHEPFHYELMATIDADDSWSAITTLRELGDGGWEALDDDGWQVDGWWSKQSGGSVFLAAAVDDAAVVLQQWSTPRRRPVSQRLQPVRRVS
jgi:hypothetical protein